MTKEEKDILLKDLCARTPYKTKINVDDIGLFIPRLKYIDEITCHFYECAWTKFIDEIKPYLRPMSSMTDEEKNVFYKLVMKFNEYELFYYNLQNRNFYEYLFTYTSELLDWLNAHHFDYRGLIEKGLAIEAPEGMYKID